MDCSPPGSSAHGDSPGKNTGVSSLSLLQGNFPTHELNWDLLHCRQILNQLSYLGSPNPPQGQLMALLRVLHRRNYMGNLPISAPYQRPRLPSHTHPFSALLPFSTMLSPSAAHAQLKKLSLHLPQLLTHPSRHLHSQCPWIKVPINVSSTHT